MLTACLFSVSPSLQSGLLILFVHSTIGAAETGSADLSSWVTQGQGLVPSRFRTHSRFKAAEIQRATEPQRQQERKRPMILALAAGWRPGVAVEFEWKARRQITARETRRLGVQKRKSCQLVLADMFVGMIHLLHCIFRVNLKVMLVLKTRRNRHKQKYQQVN